MRILITGGAGFLGGWIARRLVPAGHAVRIFDLTERRALLAQIAGQEIADQCEWSLGDITGSSDVHRAAEGCDAVIHLAGILTPACKENPLRGASVNLLGTLNVFETARLRGIERIVYTSSAAVYGPTDGHIPHPVSHYGAFKLACEGSARAYWEDHRLASIGFRPYIVYGPGREVGLTAGPSVACKAAARNEPYHIAYSGRAGLVYVDDVAAAYEAAILRQPDGARVFNLVGTVASPEDVVKEILRLNPEADIKTGGPSLPFAADIGEEDLRVYFPGLPATALKDGIRQTFDFYRTQPL